MKSESQPLWRSLHNLIGMICANNPGQVRYASGGQTFMTDYERHVKSKATLIRRFDGSAFLLSPKARKIEFKIGTKLKEVEARIKQLGWIIAMSTCMARRG